ncbi:MAG: SAM-dependent DNA methyltransferase [Planctomycetia bacterium]|nr:SAM-dependent DNA methyltransferase [Planctomycetia bacterium]
MPKQFHLGSVWLPMAKEQFFYPATQPLFKKLEQLSQQSSVSRGQAFEDFLTAMVCALAAETTEEEYLAMVERHKRGKPGQRGVDLIPEMFADLINAISREDNDVLGDLFQGAISHGENSFYLTPASVASLMAKLSIDASEGECDQSPVICDPCCGTGVLLLEAGKISPRSELVGQDIDARCAKITAINLGLRSRYGWVVCGNTVSGETQFAYRIGSFFNDSPNGTRRGVIRDVPPEQTPVPVIASRTKRDAQDLFEQQSPAATPTQLTLPTIIEVPQWLARLEPKLVALDHDKPTVAEERAEPEGPRPEAPPPKQRDLF